LNKQLLEGYAEAKDSTAVVKVQQEFLDQTGSA
jgi:ribosome biogenesis protein Tsr3